VLHFEDIYEPDHEPHEQERRTINIPWGTIGLVLTIFSTFFIGAYLENLKIGLDSPVSYPAESWLFLTIRFYPSCEDVRTDFWRVVSYQFVHEGLNHLIGNLSLLIVYGSILETFLGPVVIVIFEISVIFGAFGHSLVFPFTGLLGCSSGVYGLVGAAVSFLVTNKLNYVYYSLWGMVLFTIIYTVVDYIVAYDPLIAYESHVIGFYTGMSTGLMHRYRCTGMLMFSVMACALLWHFYAPHYPSVFYQASFNHDQLSNCCVGMMSEYERGHSLDAIRKNSYCSSDGLKVGRWREYNRSYKHASVF